MNINDWLNRCAAQYEQRAGLSKQEARELAVVALASVDDAEVITDETPEDYADGDMDCWTDERRSANEHC